MSESASQHVEGREHPRARTDVLYRELADGGLIYDSATKQVHHLNETAALVWRGCQRGAAAPAIVNELRQSYSVDEQKARTDVDSTLQRLDAGGLLLPADQTPSQ